MNAAESYLSSIVHEPKLIYQGRLIARVMRDGTLWILPDAKLNMEGALVLAQWMHETFIKGI